MMATKKGKCWRCFHRTKLGNAPFYSKEQACQSLIFLIKRRFCKPNKKKKPPTRTKPHKGLSRKDVLYIAIYALAVKLFIHFAFCAIFKGSMPFSKPQEVI